MAARLRKAGSIDYTLRRAAGPANTRKRRFLYSGSQRTALSPPAFEQCPVFPRVRADRPTSAIDRSAHERPFEAPSPPAQDLPKEG